MMKEPQRKIRDINSKLVGITKSIISNNLFVAQGERITSIREGRWFDIKTAALYQRKVIGVDVKYQRIHVYDQRFEELAMNLQGEYNNAGDTLEIRREYRKGQAA